MYETGLDLNVDLAENSPAELLSELSTLPRHNERGQQEQQLTAGMTLRVNSMMCPCNIL